MLHDVIIVGAGPCGLAIAARLREQKPSAIFTDAEHERYHWISKHQNKTSIKGRNGKVKACTQCAPEYSTLILDAAADQWLAEWTRLFRAFDIGYLRSPMFFHVDPSDRDGLLEYAYANGREQELKVIEGCVGKELSKHKKKKLMKDVGRKERAKREADINERERIDYNTPTSKLFTSHCKSVVNRYNLGNGHIRKEKVEDIDFRVIPSLDADDDVFIVKTNKAIRYARTVVLAIGSGQISAPSPSVNTPLSCHSSRIVEFPDPTVQQKIKAKSRTNILVIGGGLTSAQLGDLALRRGVSNVWMLTRSKLKVKPFDVDLAWMGKWKNHEKAVFWGKDTDADRLDAIKEARGGGSITPSYSKILEGHQRAGNLHLHENATLLRSNYCAVSNTCLIKTVPSVAALESTPIDFIYYATGVAADFASIPCLQTMNKSFPLHGHGGLPCLTEDLAWNQDIPLFMTGRLAGLRLGPGAGNLEGARMGAERVAWGIIAWLRQRNRGLGLGLGSEKDSDVIMDDDMSPEVWNYVTGSENTFESLERGHCGDDCA